jgi:hypothetical protein
MYIRKETTEFIIFTMQFHLIAENTKMVLKYMRQEEFLVVTLSYFTY